MWPPFSEITHPPVLTRTGSSAVSMRWRHPGPVETRINFAWSGLKHDLGSLGSKEDLKGLLAEVYPSSSSGKLANHNGQIWAFTHRIQPGDWIVLPSKLGPAVHIGEVTGPYVFDGSESD